VKLFGSASRSARSTLITRIKSGFATKKTAQLLLEASNGCIGQFSRIIETAVIAITRERNEVITVQDLSDAVGDWSIPNGRIGYNPFKKHHSHVASDENDELYGEDHDNEPVFGEDGR
jgi:hypothetical protein